MDFAYTEEQEAVRELAERIFSERSTHERLKSLESGAGEAGPFDRELWAELANAGLLGIGLPEDLGGAGLDFVAVCLVIEAAGRTAALVPVVETLAYAAGAIDRFGTPEQRARWLPRVCAGEVVLSAALAELVGDVVVPGGPAPATTATKAGPGAWRLEGTLACVPAGLLADAVLVPASSLDEHNASVGTGVFVLDPSAPGVSRIRQDGAARPEALIELAGVEVSTDDLLGGEGIDGAAIVTDIAEHATAALCVQEAGVIAAALALTAEYTKTREQFDKPIATFQAVGQRAADAYVDAEAIRLTAWQAAWRLSAGLPAAQELAIAKYWAAEGGQRAVHAAMHLHGGVGVDRDYPLHRFFLLTRQIELTLGSASDSLRRLGKILADDPV
jgi:alkylation response protein AidB-like acyl-CoA dehydrogenase